MHVRLLVAGASAATLMSSAALAAAPQPTKLTIAATPNPVVFGATVTLSGRLQGTNAGGRPLTLQADPYPFGDGFTAVSTGTTAKNGKYSFVPKPERNTRYRVVAGGTPAAASPERLVSVRRRVGAKVSDTTPRRGQRVRFSGTVLPKSDNKSVAIQRLSSSGRWTTVARTVTRGAGADLSVYSRRVTIRTGGRYRVKVLGDLVYVNGISRTITLTVG